MGKENYNIALLQKVFFKSFLMIKKRDRAKEVQKKFKGKTRCCVEVESVFFIDCKGIV